MEKFLTISDRRRMWQHLGAEAQPGAKPALAMAWKQSAGEAGAAADKEYQSL
jgi:hypothetical protein